MNEVIRVEGLTKSFGSRCAVSDLSFSVNRGDVYGFLGQNGAGKSTTIRMLLSLIAPDQGRIRILGDDLNTHRRSILSRTGAIIERPDLYKYLSAGDHLRLFARMNGIRPSSRLIKQHLERVGLAERERDRVSSFSQGMKQRLGLAVALIHEPELLILDEPTNGLDPQGIADMRALILSLSREAGKTILVSSHLLSEIQVIANRMLIIHGGKKITEGSVNELLHPASVRVDLETTGDEEARRLLCNSPWASFLQDDPACLRLLMDADAVPDLVAWLTDRQVGIRFVQSRPSLEAYFLSLISS